MDYQKELEPLKELQRLLKMPATLQAPEDVQPDGRYALELHKNKVFDLASELAYSFAKDAFDLWKENMPETAEVPPLLQQAYDRLPDAAKAAEGVLQAAMNQSTRDSNLNKILFHAIERMEAKYPPRAEFKGYEEEESRGAFYVEIRSVFEERDFPLQANEKQMPTLEEALALTKFLDRHEDPAARPHRR